MLVWRLEESFMGKKDAFYPVIGILKEMMGFYGVFGEMLMSGGWRSVS